MPFRRPADRQRWMSAYQLCAQLCFACRALRNRNSEKAEDDDLRVPCGKMAHASLL